MRSNAYRSAWLRPSLRGRTSPRRRGRASRPAARRRRAPLRDTRAAPTTAAPAVRGQAPGSRYRDETRTSPGPDGVTSPRRRRESRLRQHRRLRIEPASAIGAATSARTARITRMVETIRIGAGLDSPQVIVNRDPKVRGPYTAFADVAGAYERGRPGYPEEAVRWMVGDQPARRRRPRRRHGKAHTRRSSHSAIASPLSSRSTRCAPNWPPPFLAVHAIQGSAEAIPLFTGAARRRRLRTGVPLVRPRRCAAGDRTGASPGRPARARLELPRRPRPVDGAALRDHRQRDDRGVGRRAGAR